MPFSCITLTPKSHESRKEHGPPVVKEQRHRRVTTRFRIVPEVADLVTERAHVEFKTVGRVTNLRPTRKTMRKEVWDTCTAIGVIVDSYSTTSTFN